MKKKIFLYVVTGALLGIAVIFFPFRILVGSWYPFNGDAENYWVKTCRETEGKVEHYDITPHVTPGWRSNVVYAGLIALSSFVFALGISLYFKKRVV
ncbi:MAG: hypothetical protein U9O89_08275 [Thermoproteota archaeon]|nr:hypothetical protein [Thermoproteota archaeon]